MGNNQLIYIIKYILYLIIHKLLYYYNNIYLLFILYINILLLLNFKLLPTSIEEQCE